MYDPIYKHVKKEYIKSTLFNYILFQQTGCIKINFFVTNGFMESPHIFKIPLPREKKVTRLFSSKKKEKKKNDFQRNRSQGFRRRKQKSVMLHELRNFSPSFRIRGIRRNGEACCFERGEIGGDPPRSGTVLYRILSDYAKSLMEITVVSKWREDILTVPRELRQRFLAKFDLFLTVRLCVGSVSVINGSGRQAPFQWLFKCITTVFGVPFPGQATDLSSLCPRFIPLPRFLVSRIVAWKTGTGIFETKVKVHLLRHSRPRFRSR